MTSGNVYEIVGLDMAGYVELWLDESAAAALTRGGMAAAAAAGQVPRDQYQLNRALLMQGIALRAMAADAPRADLIIYAAIALHPGPGDGNPLWPGRTEFMAEAFAHLQTIGAAEAARRMLQQVIESDPAQDAPLPAFLPGPPTEMTAAEDAAEQQEMAEINDRDIRAARALDASIDFDALLLAQAARG